MNKKKKKNTMGKIALHMLEKKQCCGLLNGQCSKKIICIYKKKKRNSRHVPFAKRYMIHLGIVKVKNKR